MPSDSTQQQSAQSLDPHNPPEQHFGKMNDGHKCAHTFWPSNSFPDPVSHRNSSGTNCSVSGCALTDGYMRVVRYECFYFLHFYSSLCGECDSTVFMMMSLMGVPNCPLQSTSHPHPPRLATAVITWMPPGNISGWSSIWWPRARVPRGTQVWHRRWRPGLRRRAG